MNNLSTEDENKLVASIEKAIGFSNAGESPNDAIRKVAEERQYGPEIIQRMAEAFNKSKSAYFLKKATTEERPKAFELADAAAIIRSIYEEPVEKVASDFKLPGNDFSKLGLNADLTLEKVAAVLGESAPAGEKLYRHTMVRKLDKYAHFCKKVSETLRDRRQQFRYNFMNAVQKAASELLPLSRPGLTKVAQLIINGYPTTGPKLVKLLSAYSHRELPELEKTANAAVFPSEEPYISIAEVYHTANKLASAEAAFRVFDKEAAAGQNIFSSFLGSTASELGGLGKAEGEGAPVDKLDRLLEVVDPEVLNRMREVEARHNFMQLMLYDPQLQKYDFNDMLKAYNESVSSVADSYRHPNVLKNLMLQNLESGGVKDPFQLSQEVQIGKTLAETGKLQETPPEIGGK